MSGIIATTILALVVPRFSTLKQTIIKNQITQIVNLPGKLPYSDWVDVQRWCKENTPVDALHLVVRNTGGFRIHSQRAIVGDWKDGAPCVFSEKYAKKWWARMQELKGYDSFDEEKFKELKEKYGASIAVTRKSQKLNFPIMYQNNGFIVYRLN
ncbi:hypothetical protein GF312_14065 [Candidatus Poribacteria bacterium]|nr:hypothetical protein [Candidatus Poribacteria bacterium]